MKNINEIYRNVIRLEASALLELSDNMPLDFEKVVDLILKSSGRIIISGVGKSGHIGRKIAATLSSTGTLSFFIHPTEASHGDMGMIAKDDIILLISNSGETSELFDIVAHAKRFQIKLIVISSNINSSISKNADLRLLLPQVKEACRIGVAPTTSTTLTLALGDALAVSLMDLREFGQKDFKVFHPGGKLGKQLTHVDKVMRPKSEMAILSENSAMMDVILKMTQTGYGIAFLTNKFGDVTGVITDGDLRRHANRLMEVTPTAIMSKSPISVNSDELIDTALKKMETHKVYSILVQKEQKPIGLLRLHDIIRS